MISACGSTSTAPTAGPASSHRRSGRCTTASSSPTPSWSTRTSGCTRRSTARPCSTATPQLARAVHTQEASYLDAIHDRPDEWNPTDYAYHLTRRARGLPLWFSLVVNGTDAYRDAIESTLELTRQVAREIELTAHLTLLREPTLGVVLFRREGWDTADYDAWAHRLLAAQIAFVTSTTWEGETVGRLVFLHPGTTLDVVREVLASTA